MFDAIRLIAEKKIREAITEGRLNTENWRGRPLPDDRDIFIPEDLRMAYKILKNSGFLPPEIEAKKKIQQLEELIAASEDEHLKLKQMKKLNLLCSRLNIMRNAPANLEEHKQYYSRVVEKISVNSL